MAEDRCVYCGSVSAPEAIERIAELRARIDETKAEMAALRRHLDGLLVDSSVRTAMVDRCVYCGGTIVDATFHVATETMCGMCAWIVDVGPLPPELDEEY